MPKWMPILNFADKCAQLQLAREGTDIRVLPSGLGCGLHDL